MTQEGLFFDQRADGTRHSWQIGPDGKIVSADLITSQHSNSDFPIDDPRSQEGFFTRIATSVSNILKRR